MSRPVPALLFPLLFLALADGVRACTNVTGLSTAMDTMLAEYEREAAPATPVRVRTTFDLRHAALRRDSTVHVLGDLTLSWQEPRLSWNKSEWLCDYLSVASEQLWRPAVELLNSAGGGEESALTARLTGDGNVSWVLRYDAYVPIVVNLAQWPNDQQIAVFKFGAVPHSSGEIELEITKTEHVVLFESGEWELMSVSESLEWRGEQPVAAYTAVLRRRAGAHAAAAGAVLAAAVLLLLAAAALPPLARPPLCACAVFTTAIWLVTALLRLPSSSTTPVALSALGVVCAAGGAAGAAAALVASVARRSAEPPRPLRSLASTLSRLCRLTPPEGTASSASSGAWAALAALLDYVLIGALLLTLFVVVCIYL